MLFSFSIFFDPARSATSCAMGGEYNIIIMRLLISNFISSMLRCLPLVFILSLRLFRCARQYPSSSFSLLSSLILLYFVESSGADPFSSLPFAKPLAPHRAKKNEPVYGLLIPKPEDKVLSSCLSFSCSSFHICDIRPTSNKSLRRRLKKKIIRRSKRRRMRRRRRANPRPLVRSPLFTRLLSGAENRSTSFELSRYFANYWYDFIDICLL